mmetsp:Transcript_6509/g.27701  ORF Transcript_6509/g.27701 Transcript_6509/m.27701 type:complete len:253 (-) Transcript_6509:790-1548(-)
MLLGPIQSHATDLFSRRDYKPALYRFVQSAFMGSKSAQYNAAFMIERKLGVEGSMMSNASEIAFQLYQQAESQKVHIATMRLADMMYEHGAYEQASEAYQKAKSCGATEAQFNIGVMHMTGKGLAMDYHLAKRNFDLAAQSEDGYIPSAIAQCVLRFCTPRQALCTLIFDVAYVIRGRMSYEDLELPEKQVFQRLIWEELERLLPQAKRQPIVANLDMVLLGILCVALLIVLAKLRLRRLTANTPEAHPHQD